MSSRQDTDPRCESVAWLDSAGFWRGTALALAQRVCAADANRVAHHVLTPRETPMNTAFSTSAFVKFISLASLLGAVACSGGDPSSGSTQNPITGAPAQCADEEANDKITCSVDGDCDSDETCVSGLCTGADGEAEDGTCDADDDEDGADDADDEDGADKITCATDADCDSDEYCSDGLCTGMPEACASDADCDSDEACANGLCEDR